MTDSKTLDEPSTIDSRGGDSGGGDSGTSGGRLQREIGAIDDEITAVEGRPRPVSVHKGQHPDGGDEPNLPNRTQAGGDDKVPPRRTS